MKIKRIIIVFLIFIGSLSADGAGVLPYAISPKNNKVYFLFSREHSGSDIGKWAEFGGGIEKEDKNNLQYTAAREFSEESAGLFGDKYKISKFLEKDNSVIKHGHSRYVIYLIPVKFDYDINKEFLNKRCATKDFHKREKDAIAWVSAGQLLKVAQDNKYLPYTIDGERIFLRDTVKNMITKYFVKDLTNMASGKVPALGHFFK